MLALVSIADGTMDDATKSETYPFRRSNQVISDRDVRENVCMYHLHVSNYYSRKIERIKEGANNKVCTFTTLISFVL